MKRNKKLFAILTLVAFMMTLMPVMAFATTSTIGSPDYTAVGAMELALDSWTDEEAYVVADSAVSGAKVDLSGTKTDLTATSTTITVPQANVLSENTIVIVADGAGAAAAKDTVILAQYDITDEDVTRSYGAIYAAGQDLTKAEDFIAAYDKAVASDLNTLYDSAKSLLEGDLNLEAAKIMNAFTVALADGDNVYDKAAGAITSAKYSVAFQSAEGLSISNLGVVSTQAKAQNGSLTFELKNTKTGITKTVVAAASIEATSAADLDGAVAALNGATITVAKGATTATIPANAQFGGATFQLISVSSNLTANVDSVAIANATTIGNFKVAATAATGTATIRVVAGGKSKDVTVTLVFAGGSSDVSTSTSVDASIIATKDENASVEAESSANVKSNVFYYNVDGVSTIMPDTKYAEIELVLRQANNASITGTQTVYVWAEESSKSRQATDALKLNMGNQDTATANQNVYKMTVGSVSTIQAAFVRAGTYTIKASIVDPTKGMENGLLASNTATFKTVTNKNTITATALAQETRLFTVKVASGANADNVIDASLIDGEKSDKHVAVSANTVATTKVTLTVKNKSGSLMSTYPIKLSTNSGNIELDKTSITTDYKGEATFNIAGLREGEYKVYVNIGDYEATILVQVGATSANSIELIKFPSNPIATDTMVSDYKDVFRFQLTDANGNIVKDTYKGAEYAALVATDGTSSSEQAKYAYIVSAPEANKVKNADLKLKYVSGKDYYTLDVDNNKSFSAEGDYEVRVVLNNGKSVTLNFTVKKFDKAVSLHIEYPTQAVELNSKTDAPDIYFLDANNVMKKANNRVTVAASGYAVAGVVESGSDAGTLTVKNDEKYIGQTITVTAASDKENLMATTTLTVADEAREVKLDSTRGQVNANNRVGFKVVDSTGKAVALGNDATVDVTAVVTNTGDADAKVSYSVSGSSKADLKSNGTGVINLSSNKETTATVQIMVKVSKPLTNANDNNTGLSTTYYSGTETFTFGAEADKSVVMTIGSKELVANNVPVATDVAPFIKDNRTWVPFRALTEAFGAEVDYNAENNTVTAKLNGKTVVLTVGSTVLTVNDEAVTMDVAPYIVDDRVVVPVRFVGEAFGFTVEATQDETGATASVVFYQK